MGKTKASDIVNIDKIKNGEFRDTIPELYELKEVIENNDWHNNDSVFNHTLTALKSLEGLLMDIRDEVKDYLNQRIDGYTRKELLLLATLFHDIAKKETIIKQDDKSSFPNHDEEGSIKAGKILSRFDLSEEEKNLVSQTIQHHLIIYLVLSPFHSDPDKGLDEVKKKYPSICWEVILLGMADTLACQPNNKVIDEFNFRVDFYKKILSQ